ncbi:hypothetical protein C8R45DRAFT_1104052 [Mycena sanguinolenta]|nr:hypothetical protein C8R45DRAFT_1104052 [Mycena sanguinolenta]
MPLTLFFTNLVLPDVLPTPTSDSFVNTSDSFVNTSDSFVNAFAGFVNAFAGFVNTFAGFVNTFAGFVNVFDAASASACPGGPVLPQCAYIFISLS